MKRTPHTSCRKGKRVIITLIDGTKVLTKFVERTPKFIVTDDGKYTVSEIRAFGIYKQTNQREECDDEPENT